MRSIPERLVAWLPALILPGLFLGGLEWAARAGAVNPVFLPPPSRIFETCFALIVAGDVFAPVLHTLFLLFAGYCIGCAAAIALGILMGWSQTAYDLFEPLIEVLRPIPKPALLPALMLFLGIGATMGVTTVALASFFPVVISTIQGARAVDPTMIDTARTFGHSRFAICWRILLPASAPYILTGMRISLGIGLVMVVLSEMISGTGGLGDAILNAQRTLRVTESYAWLVILAVLGLLLTTTFQWVERRLAFWQGSQTS